MGNDGRFRALVALRAKRGEFEALKALKSGGPTRSVQPLLQLVPGSKAPAAQLDEVEAVVRHLHKLGRHVMLDASEVAGLAGFGGGPAGALGELASRLAHPPSLFDQQSVVPFIPVIRGEADDDKIATVGRLMHELGIGGALRVQAEWVSRASISAVLDRLSVDLELIDLVVDLKYVPEIPDQLVQSTSQTLEEIAGLGGFRSISLLSGSVPRMLSQTSIWEAPRVEEQLWATLRKQLEELRLGDYGVVHPRPSESWPSKHVALKYTCPRRWLYSRERIQDEDNGADDGSLTESSKAQTLRVLCHRLVDSRGFAGADFSWGDQQIAAAADGHGAGLGESSKPVAFATSHHLAYLAGGFAAP